ncbi:MAG: NAD(P)H-dependent oxidoreductase [Christensenellaceae bacterium]|jgi:multimeric flavodoxin WrbA|nr:NAD(P)H-dependent oxidoreductase [Christensenellaceae bacterium]
MEQSLTVVSIGRHTRLTQALQYALSGVPHDMAIIDTEGDMPCLRGKRVLFALSVGAYGLSAELCRLLLHLRAQADALDGSVAALLIDGESELYTKQLAQMLVLSANGAGCCFIGKPLVEGTGSLANLAIHAGLRGGSLLNAYCETARGLVERLRAFQPPQYAKPRMLVLHASDHATSNTLDLSGAVCTKLAGAFDIRELSLQNGAIMDCRGCSYKTCAHFAQHNACFYGGVMVDDVFPALLNSQVLLLLCPNYNDSVSANIMAFINRLTVLLVNNAFYSTYLYAIVVSGYSGGDLVAQQVLGALCLNKTFLLPPRFCLLQTACDPGAALKLPGIQEQIDSFAQSMLDTVVG